MKMDLFKVYTNGPGGEPIEYMGGANYPGGKRKCPNCASEMKRSPVGVAYIETGSGFTLIDTTPKNGMMVVTKVDPKYIWDCGGCTYAIKPHKKQEVLV